VEIGCPGCGRVYSPAEIKELVKQHQLAGKGDRLSPARPNNEVA